MNQFRDVLVTALIAIFLNKKEGQAIAKKMLTRFARTIGPQFKEVVTKLKQSNQFNMILLKTFDDVMQGKINTLLPYECVSGYGYIQKFK